MAREKLPRSQDEAWKLAREQHGVVTRQQLLDLGFSEAALEHRIRRGRLHRLGKGIYAVGRAEVSRHGRLIAAVLSCGPQARVSHESAGWLWGVSGWKEPIHVVVPRHVVRRRPGIKVHRRKDLESERGAMIAGIAVTDPVNTVIDLASGLPRARLERAIRDLDRLELVDPEELMEEIGRATRRPGVGRLRETLEAATFALADSELERRFLRLVEAAALPLPRTQVWLNGYRVDFYWPELGLIVETDGLTYHRTPSQQRSDRERDQAHAAAGMTPLRFTAFQVRFEPRRTVAVLSAVVSRLRASMKHHQAHSPGNPSSEGYVGLRAETSRL